MVHICIVWVKFETPLELRLRTRPVPIVVSFHIGHRSMRFRQRLIQLQGFRCGSLGLWESFLRTGLRIEREVGVRIGQSSICRCVLRISFECLAKVFKGQL